MKSYFLQPYNSVRLLMVFIVVCPLALGLLPDPAWASGVLIAMSVAPFPVTPEMTAIAVAYRNEEFVADRVMPRVPVGVKTFKYMKYTLADRFTIPDTRVGRKGSPNEVEFSATEVEASAQDYGLDDPVPQDDIDQAPSGYDPLGNAVEGVMELVLLDREKRVADLVFAAAQYAAANKVQLAGNDQWSSTHADSDPVADIQTGLDACIMRPNILVIGRLAWTQLAKHAKIAAAIFKQGTSAGIATRQQVAELFELEEIIVGQAWVNTAKKGQAMTKARVWGKHCALLRRDKNANTRRGVTFGYTAQYGTRVAGSMADSKIGLRGGQRVRAGETVKEVITANDLGYFIEDCIA